MPYFGIGEMNGEKQKRIFLIVQHDTAEKRYLYGARGVRELSVGQLTEFAPWLVRVDNGENTLGFNAYVFNTLKYQHDLMRSEGR